MDGLELVPNKPIATTASRIRINLLGTINLKIMRVEVKSYITINQESVSDYFFILKKAYLKAKYPKIHNYCRSWII